MVLEVFFGHLWGKKHWGDGVMRDLEVTLRAQGPVHPAYDTMLERCGTFAYYSRLLGCTFSVLGGGFLLDALWFPAKQIHVPFRAVPKLFGTPAPRLMLMLGCSCACMPVMAKMQYYDLQHGFAKILLKHGEEDMKMELAKIILNNHSDDKSLVEAVKRHFVANHLFSDQHQEKPLLRWRERGSYVDSGSLEKMKEHEAALKNMLKELKASLKMMIKEYEARNSDDGAKSSVDVGLFQEDPLACMLGTPGYNTEINKLHEQSPASTSIGGTNPARSELKAHRRSHQHRRRRHADKTAVL